MLKLNLELQLFLMFASVAPGRPVTYAELKNS